MNIKKRFTKWYVKKGYTFGYDFSKCETIGGDDIFPPMPLTQPVVVWRCPWYIKPFLFLFSPSIYAAEDWGKQVIDGFMAGMQMKMEAKEDGRC